MSDDGLDPPEWVNPPPPRPAPSGARSRSRRRARAERKRHRRRTAAALAVVVGLVVPFVLAGGWFVYQLNPPGSRGDPVTVEIRQGWGIARIGDALQDRGVIGSSLAFQLYSRLTGAGPFDGGAYRLHRGLGVRDAIDVLDDGRQAEPPDEVQLDLPPGLTLEQIADRVSLLPGRDRQVFLDAAASGSVRSRYQPPEVTSLEGLLGTGTYVIGEDDNETAILRRLVDGFDAAADELNLEGVAGAAGRSPYETVVIASLIEREAGVAEDRPLISAVIRNRLADGTLLQIDATLCYAKGGCDSPPTDADKLLDSAYNTYRFVGLPPTPIAAVSEASLTAASAPADVAFRFYVLADENGRHAFAVTQEEHEQNVARAREQGLI